MLTIKLVFSLFMPWLCGYVWLVLIENKLPPRPTHTLRQVGYGFFVGYSVLYGCIYLLSALGGGLAFWPVFAAISVITLVGLVLWHYRKHRPGLPITTTVAAPAAGASLLGWILLIWIGLHLSLVAIEILNQPVYPWDAWTNWVYRARAWFYSGDLVSLSSYDVWLRESAADAYTIGARDYPTFASVIPLWVAVTLGQWSDSLVNLPGLLCGIAIGLGLYGQCRELAVPRWLSIVGAYLFLSIPLVGTHLSLGGYADIWLSGFAGLGISALLAGTMTRYRYLQLLGIAMIAMGALVKNEGMVWLYLSLLVYVLSFLKLRFLLLAATVLTLVLVAFGYLTGHTYLGVPGLGEVGYRDGTLLLPFIGVNQLQLNNIAEPLWRNAFVRGTWHLLWLYVALCLVALLYLRKLRSAKTVAIFIFLLLFSVYFIFGLTEQGRWAESWTAINRLLLHFVPALILCITLCCHWLLARDAPVPSTDDSRGRFASIGPAVVTAIFVLAGALVYLGAMNNAPRGLTPAYTLSEPRLVLGGGYVKDGVPYISSYQQGSAVVSSGPVVIPAAGLPVLNYDIESDKQGSVEFFWRNAASPEGFHLVQLETNKPEILALGGHPGWRGEISEVGLMFTAVEGGLFGIRGLHLEEASLAASLYTVLGDWLHFEPWSAKSINWLYAGRSVQALSLSLLLASWLLLSLVFYALATVLGFSRRRALTSYLSCLLIAWCVLDIRWTVNSLRQAHTSVYSQSGGGRECLDVEDCRLREFASSIRKHVQDKGDGRLLIARFDNGQDFRPYRLKYHMLPVSAAIFRGRSLHVPWGERSHVVVLWEIHKRHSQQDALELVRQALPYKKIRLTVLEENNEGVLIEVRRGKEKLASGREAPAR